VTDKATGVLIEPAEASNDAKAGATPKQTKPPTTVPAASKPPAIRR
jgi:hypothetical protein